MRPFSKHSFFKTFLFSSLTMRAFCVVSSDYKLSISDKTRSKNSSPKSLVIPIDSVKRRIKLDQGLKMWTDGAASSAPASSCGCEEDLRQWVVTG